MAEAAPSAAEASAAPQVLVEDRGPVRILTLSRPQSRNALSLAMMEALTARLAEAAAAPDIRAIVIEGRGPAFCAGHDLKEVRAARAAPDRGEAAFRYLMAECVTLMLAVQRQPQPVIAAVEGVATAAGCQLVASCDLAVAGAAARFATPGVHIGLFCSTPMVALSRNVADKQAMEMLLLGEMIDAGTALRFGLVNRVVAEGEAVEAAVGLGGIVAAKAPAVVRLGKETFYRQRHLSTEDAYALTAEVMVQNLLARDSEEGIAAFIEKRAPQWEPR